MPVFLRRAALCLLILTALHTAGADDEENDPSLDLYYSQNSVPSIDGTPPAIAIPGQLYQFVPTASDIDGDPLSFAATNLPGWLTLDRATGAISGVPSSADHGEYGNIHLLVSDGDTSAWIGPFAISVIQGANSFGGELPGATTLTATGSATLSWLPPTAREDGTPLLNLAGYRIYASQTPGTLTLRADLSNPGLTRHVLDGLTAGDWWFAMTAYDAAGIESDWSAMITKTVH